jgi:hypothetical protein
MPLVISIFHEVGTATNLMKISEKIQPEASVFSMAKMAQRDCDVPSLGREGHQHGPEEPSPLNGRGTCKGGK